MKRSRVTFLVLMVLVAAVSCNTDDTDGTVKETEFVEDAKCNYMYIVGDDKQPPCILANMEISLDAEYETKNGTSKMAHYDVTSATATGTCSPVMSELVITWAQGSVKFVLLNKHTTFLVMHVAFKVSLDDKDAEVKELQKAIDLDEGLLSGNIQEISVCADGTTIPIDKSNIKVSKVKLIAFNSNDTYCKRNESQKQCSTEKIFSYDIGTNNNPISTLASMSFSLEIPYTQTNGKVQLYRQTLTNVATVDNVHYNDKERQTYSADLHWFDNSNKLTLSIIMSTHDDGTAYIDTATVDIFISKANLENSKYNINRKGNITLRLFPVAAGNGLYSCKTGNILRFGDVKMTVTNVLFAPFHTGNNFTVTECNPETALSARMFNYVVRDQNSGVPCILGNMTIALNMTYKRKDEFFPWQYDTKTIVVPTNATTIGSCDKYMPYMDLSWPGSTNETKKDKMNRLLISFYQTSGLYYANFVKADIYNDPEIFQDTFESDEWLHSISTTTLRLFPNNMTNGFYKCSDTFEAVINKTTKIKINDVALMAFNDQDDISIKVQQSHCQKDNDTDKNNGTTPQKYHYIVYPKNSKIPCTLANMNIDLNIHYATKTGTDTKLVQVPANATYNGTCGSEKSTLNIVWPSEQDHKNWVNLTFNKESSRFFLHQIEMSIDTTSFPKTNGETFKGHKDNLMLFSAAASNTYKCESQEDVTGDQFTATFSKVTLIVFNDNADLTKRSEENCSTADVGAIVGGIIGGLIIVGIIGYVVYRYRRSRY